MRVEEVHKTCEYYVCICYNAMEENNTILYSVFYLGFLVFGGKL